MTQAQSPLSIMEQLTAACWTRLLAASAMVFTNKRILFFPIKRDGSWRESVRAAHGGDRKEVKPSGLLVRNISFKFKFAAKVTYTNFRRGDANKIAAIASALLPAAPGEQTATPGVIQLCPDCRTTLRQTEYACPACNLTFKSEKSTILRSIFLPGGGYFYTAHPVIGSVLAFFEVILLLDVVIILVAGLTSPRALAGMKPALLLLALFWSFKTVVTIRHCRRYVREFIPHKRDPGRVPQPVHG